MDTHEWYICMRGVYSIFVARCARCVIVVIRLIYRQQTIRMEQHLFYENYIWKNTDESMLLDLLLICSSFMGGCLVVVIFFSLSLPRDTLAIFFLLANPNHGCDFTCCYLHVYTIYGAIDKAQICIALFDVRVTSFVFSLFSFS